MNNMQNLELEDEEMEFSHPQKQQQKHQNEKSEAPDRDQRLHERDEVILSLNDRIEASSIFRLQRSAEVCRIHSSNEDVYTGVPIKERFARGQHPQPRKRKHGDSSLAMKTDDNIAKRQHRHANYQQEIEGAQGLQHSILSSNHDSTDMILPDFAFSTMAHDQPRSSAKSRISTTIFHPIRSDNTLQAHSDQIEAFEVFMDSDMKQEACVTTFISQEPVTEFAESSTTKTLANAYSYLDPKAEYQVLYKTTPLTKWEHLGPIPSHFLNDGKEDQCANVHLNLRNIVPAVSERPAEDINSSYWLQPVSSSPDISRNSLTANPQNLLDSEPPSMKPKRRQVRFANPLHSHNSGRLCSSFQSSQSDMNHNTG
jgi:hypothetical protein